MKTGVRSSLEISASGNADIKSSFTAATRAPSSRTRRSPITTIRAFSTTSSRARSLAVNSGLMPAGSPIASATTGLIKILLRFSAVKLVGAVIRVLPAAAASFGRWCARLPASPAAPRRAGPASSPACC